MLNRLLIIVAFFGLNLLAFAQPSEESIAWSIFQRVLKRSQGNVAYSPLGMQRSSALLYLGARGETAASLGRIFAFPEPALFRDEAGKRRERLEELRKSVQWESAAGLFAANSLPLLPDYVQLAANLFNAQVQTIPSEPAAAVKIINAWCSAQTHGKIAEIAREEDIQPGGLLIEDTLYLEARWKKAFSKKATRAAQFSRDEQKTATPMMYQELETQYSQTKDWEMVELPYIGDRLVFDALLPRHTKGSCPPLSWKELLAVRKQAHLTKVDIYLPRFSTRSSHDLLPLLKQQGLPEVCDLSSISPGASRVHSMRQEAWVQVDEEGAKAAAVTQTGVIWQSMKVRPPVPEFLADHPFLFVIRDRETGLILFCGQVEQPEVSSEKVDVEFEEWMRSLPRLEY